LKRVGNERRWLEGVWNEGRRLKRVRNQWWWKKEIFS